LASGRAARRRHPSAVWKGLCRKAGILPRSGEAQDEWAPASSRRHRAALRRLEPFAGIRDRTMATEPKVAIITGASQGIGAGLVQAYRARKYRVIANSRSI